jgi:hypothetical protein
MFNPDIRPRISRMALSASSALLGLNMMLCGEHLLSIESEAIQSGGPRSTRKAGLSRDSCLGSPPAESRAIPLIMLPFASPGAAMAQEQPFLAPPAHVGPPLAWHATTNRAFQSIPSLAVARKGRLWATWYAGITPGE